MKTTEERLIEEIIDANGGPDFLKDGDVERIASFVNQVLAYSLIEQGDLEDEID